jgi:hypothetical protein
MATTVRSVFSELMRLAARHWIFVTLVIVGAAIRVLATVAYRPAFMFFGDSFSYIIGAQRLSPPNDRPFGYSAFLRLASYFGDLQLVVVLQHVAGVALAVAIYAVLIKRGAPPWLSALVSAPLLLDAYLIQIEKNILSETLFATLLVAAVLLVTRETMTVRTAATIGLLLAAATLTRNVALPIAAMFVGYLLIRRVGWRPVIALGTALTIPIMAYMAWFAATYGVVGTNDSSGRFLYGRVAVFADCNGVDLTAKEAELCDNSAPALRPNANFYVWSGDSPVRGLGLPGTGNDQVASSFAKKIIFDQPLTYATYVGTDIAHYFAPGRYLTRVDSPDTPWRFPESVATGSGSTSVAHNDLSGNPVAPTVTATPAALMRAYQSVVYTQGPLLALGLILGVAAGWMQRGPRRWDGPFVAAVGFAVLAIPSLTVMFDYRYGLPAIPLFAYAGGIGAIALRARLAERAAARVSAGDAGTTVQSTSIRPGAGHRRPQTGRPLLSPGVAVGAVGLMAVTVVLAPMQANASFENYVSNRAELGPLGPPLGGPEPIPGLIGATQQQFVTGSIIAVGGGAGIVPQRYARAIEDAGGYATLGPPRDREQQSPYTSGERFLRFETGIIFWSRLEGARSVTGDIYETWNAKKVKSRLKEPLADAETVDDGSAIQRFAGGTIARFSDGSVEVTVAPARGISASRPADPIDRSDSSLGRS